MAEEEKPKFDARLKEGVAYFEEMLRVMPDDRTTLEFLSVAYPQLGEKEKAESALAALARTLLKEGDFESAAALLPNLDACEKPEAKAMAVKIRAVSAPRPDLKPEAAAPVVGSRASACASEAALAEDLGEKEVADHIRALSSQTSMQLVSALATITHEHGTSQEKALATLADKYGTPPIPLGAFELADALLKPLSEEIVRVRGVIPFAQIGETVLVAYLSPQDAALRRAVSSSFAPKTVRFFLADPTLVEAALAKLYPEKV